MAPVTAAYRLGATLARWLPQFVIDVIVELGARLAIRVSPSRARMAGRNLARAHGRPPDEGASRREVLACFRTYGHYWAESFRLPSLAPSVVDAGFDVTGYGHIARAHAQGRGVILALPHLGGWEWSGFWLTEVMGMPVTAVVEAIEPPDLRDFFLGLRQSIGINVVILGPGAGMAVSAALRRGDIVCLLADRDIEGTGVATDFFGEITTLPSGPAVLGLRTGAPVLPAAVYFDGRRHHAVVRPPLPVERRDGFRADVARVTAALAGELEELVRAAPDQWHLLQPNWPSDHAAVGG